MIAVQKPPSMFSSPAFRPAHARLTSVPVVVRPSHVPGVLNLSKPVQFSPRPQHAQPQSRAPRVSPKNKPQQRSPQLSRAQPAPVEKSQPAPLSLAKVEQPTPTSDSSPRGRKQHKNRKDSGRRGASVSPSDVAARRHAHQPSPTPVRTPSPSQKAPAAPRAQVSRAKPEVSSDPFIVDVDAASKQDCKAPRSAPKLASQPSGKLARRRQAGQHDSPVPQSPLAARSAGPPTRRLLRTPSQSLLSVALPLAAPRPHPPTTPIREVASVPPKAGMRGTWQQENFIVDDAPRTAPLSSTVGFPFAGTSPCSTPTPAQRRRNHRRVPSEGVFAMSTDEESASSSASDLFEAMHIKRRGVTIPRARCSTGPSPSAFGASTVDQLTSSSAPSLAAGFFAGSVFQNSPSPDDLPAPSFAV
ncbi:uncharacterized protein BXZ73DRAFT_75035 [Epithele typhae]|uniref:uncharacterized protein n=1 Tax=Epithele typhae TaxID=378194 RepID=UPI002008D098|nr:uncharacterized protein BXZ73DRAFT_75035 [Epithele typhae]KAH9941863.1 hypothetical protein BXZ73DRAFT_75035 [Epithele typhae]